jgi:hypothetical protein
LYFMFFTFKAITFNDIAHGLFFSSICYDHTLNNSPSYLVLYIQIL